MKRILAAAALALVGASVAALSSGDAVAGARTRIDFDPGTFSYALVAPRDGVGRVQYYLPYTVKNTADDEQTPRLRIEVRTETKKTFGDHFDAKAYEAIAKDMRTKSVPCTFDLRKSALAGGATASAAAHFGRMDDNADELEVRVYGLWDPVYRDKRGVRWRENRVLVLKYRRYGDEYSRYEDKIHLMSRSTEIEGTRDEIIYPGK